MKKVLFGLLALSSLSFSAASLRPITTLDPGPHNHSTDFLDITATVVVNSDNSDLSIVDENGNPIQAVHFTHEFLSGEPAGTKTSAMQLFKLKKGDKILDATSGYNVDPTLRNGGPQSLTSIGVTNETELTTNGDFTWTITNTATAGDQLIIGQEDIIPATVLVTINKIKQS